MLLVVILTASAAAQENPQNDLTELELSRRLITALERENVALKDRLAAEKEANRLLAELNAARKSEPRH